MIVPLALIFTCFRLSSSLECGSPGESFHHESDCRSYYVCDSMKTTRLFTCQDGQHYDKIQGRCVDGHDEECALNKDISAMEDHEKKTTMRVHAGPEMPYQFTLDMKKVMEKLGKLQNNNQEEETKEGEMGDNNEEHIEKRQIKEDERDKTNDDDEIHESPNTEDMKKDEETKSQAPVETSQDKIPEGAISKEKSENLEDESQKELDNPVAISGVVDPTDQKVLFPELPVYPGLVPLNVQTKSTQTMSYGYPETVQQYKNLENVEEVMEEEDQHDLIGKENTEGEKHQGDDDPSNSGEQTEKVEEESGKGEKEHTKADEEDKIESHNDETPVDGEKKVQEDLQDGEHVDGSIGQKATDLHNSGDNGQVSKNDEPTVNKDDQADKGSDE